MTTQIIYQGSLTLEKLKELASQHLQLKDDSKDFNPSKNSKTISLTEQEDGNWKGVTQKNGKLVEIRTNDPQTALLGLITHA